MNREKTELKITEDLLAVNEYSRPERKLKEKRAVILHWTGSPGQKAAAVRAFFASAVTAKHYASAHYCVDIDGTILRLIPDDEVAYHCGSSQNDPASGKIYTDWARYILGPYAENPQANSPNNATLGIEMCTIDNEGHFSPQTLNAAEKLTAYLCAAYKIPLERVGTHNMVVGWKDCPRFWTRYPEQFEVFKLRVAGMLEQRQ
jgi:N-acetylmuramoyl-L-alanine amidase